MLGWDPYGVQFGDRKCASQLDRKRAKAILKRAEEEQATMRPHTYSPFRTVLPFN